MEVMLRQSSAYFKISKIDFLLCFCLHNLAVYTIKYISFQFFKIAIFNYLFFSYFIAKINKNDLPDTSSTSSCASLPPASHIKPPTKMIPSSRSNLHSISSSTRPGTGLNFLNSILSTKN